MSTKCWSILELWLTSVKRENHDDASMPHRSTGESGFTLGERRISRPLRWDTCRAQYIKAQPQRRLMRMKKRPCWPRRINSMTGRREMIQSSAQHIPRNPAHFKVRTSQLHKLQIVEQTLCRSMPCLEDSENALLTLWSGSRTQRTWPMRSSFVLPPFSQCGLLSSRSGTHGILSIGVFGQLCSWCSSLNQQSEALSTHLFCEPSAPLQGVFGAGPLLRQETATDMFAPL